MEYLKRNNNDNAVRLLCIRSYQIDKSSFKVQSTSTPGLFYTVDVDLEICSCPVGISGAPCKHQAGVFKAFPTDSHTYLPVTAKMKAQLLQIATGSK